MGSLERLSTEEIAAPTLLAAEHIHRYRLASQAIGSGRVLDLGCGTGYGSILLAQNGCSVVGVDIDPAAVNAAIAATPNELDIEYVAADAGEYLIEHAHEFDAIVAFEVIEHLEFAEKLAELLLLPVRRGKLVIASVPNSKYFHEVNEFHLTDFDRASADAYFSKIGEHVLLEQHLAEGSWIGSGASDQEDAALVLREAAETIAAHHFIALFNAGEPVASPDSAALMQFVVAPENARYIRNLERSNRELHRVNSQLARSQFAQNGQAGGIHGSGAAAKLRRLDVDRESLVKTSGELRSQIDRVEAELTAIKGSMTWSATKLPRRLLRPLKRMRTKR